MKHIAGLPLLFVTALVVSLVTHGTNAEDTPPPDALHLIYFSSAPEIVQKDGTPGLAELATAIQMHKAQHQEAYFLFGGASLGPSLLGALDKGAHMIDILNGLQPEFMAVMKREFSYGVDHLTLNAYASAFPMVTSNLVLAGTGSPIDGLESYYLLEGRNLSVGFLTITSGNAINEYGAAKAKMLETDRVVAETSAMLRQLGADAVFIMADTDFDDLSHYREKGLVDGIFYSHNFDNPQSLDAQGSIITEGPLDGQMLILSLWKDADANLKSHARTAALIDFAPNTEISNLIADYRGRLQERLSPPIATLATSFDTLRENVRTGENAFGNFVADSARGLLKADVFLLNSGAIRGNRKYSAGATINRGDIQRELPFGNRTAILKLTGAVLRRTIEYGLDCASRADGCTLQVSNMKIIYDSEAPMGERTKEIWIAGALLDDTKLYEVGMSDFMATGNDGYEWLRSAEPVVREGTNRTLWDLIAENCERMQMIAPELNGRIKNIRKAS